MTAIVKSYQQGAIIFKEGQASDTAYFVVEGSVDVCRHTCSGMEIFSTVKKGQFFGEMALINKKNRTATAVAKEYTTVLVVTERLFNEYFESSPKPVQALIKTVSKRIGETTSRTRARCKFSQKILFLGSILSYIDIIKTEADSKKALPIYFYEIHREARKISLMSADDIHDVLNILNECGVVRYVDSVNDFNGEISIVDRDSFSVQIKNISSKSSELLKNKKIVKVKDAYALSGCASIEGMLCSSRVHSVYVKL